MIFRCAHIALDPNDNDVQLELSKILDKKDIKILNIGSGNGSSIKNILDFLNNHNIKIKTKNIQREELKISTADISKLKELLKKDTFFGVEDYLKKELNI